MWWHFPLLLLGSSIYETLSLLNARQFEETKSQFLFNKFMFYAVTGISDALPKYSRIFISWVPYFSISIFFRSWLIFQPLRSDSSALFYILLRDFLLFVFLSLSGVFLYLYALNERESFDISLSSPFRRFRPIWSFRHRVSSGCTTTHTRYLQCDLIFSSILSFLNWAGNVTITES